jgi:hypothetical protein
MKAITLEDLPIIIDDGVQLRLRDEDGMSVGFVRLPAGADLRPATTGLPDDLCPCPHWGYMVKGRVRMHTTDGHQDFRRLTAAGIEATRRHSIRLRLRWMRAARVCVAGFRRPAPQ